MNTILQSMRLPFLLLTPICIFLAVSLLIFNDVEFDYFNLALILIGAISAHISVNTLNEYTDFKSGLDLMTKRTDFSGGSGALPQNPEMLNAVLITGITALLITSIIGLFFVWQFSVEILPLGLIGLLLVITYTTWINKNPWLCLIAPGLGFGLLMLLGTHFVLTGQYSLQSFLIALIPFFLINNLLLLNQYPDIEADKKVGRNHFPIAFGVVKSNHVYAISALAVLVVIGVNIYLNYLPVLALIALIPMPIAWFVWRGAMKYQENIGSYPQFLGANVALTLLVPLLLAIVLVLAS